MFGIAFVCYLWDLCWALGLSVCLLVGWWTYVWHCICLLFVGLMFGIAFVCYLWDLCWALGLSVCWLGDLCLVMVGLFGTSTAD